MVEVKVPDIMHGSIILGYLGPNSYLTGVQCALSLEEPDSEPKYAFLAQGCRYENVIAQEKASESTIFGRPPGERAVLHTWDGVYAFRTRTYVGRSAPSRTLHLSPSKINIDFMTPRYLSFDETFELVSTGRISPRDLFMHIRWGQGLSLYCRCENTNYPISELRPGEKYLQPLSGQVCYYENGSFYIAYVACSLRHDGSQHVEFCVRDSVNVVDTAHNSGKLRSLFPLIRRILPVYVHEYTRSVPVDGQCRFYTYTP